MNASFFSSAVPNGGNVSGSNLSSSGALDIPEPINAFLNVSSILILLITMVSLGCSMEIAKIKAHFLRPRGIGIALLAQFCVMPLTAFSLAKALHMSPVKAVTVLICGCCPGGNLSNIFSLALKGDMNLSIVMTTCSCLAALALMPLLLYVFSQGFTGLENAVPYVGIVSTLLLSLLPCAVGIAINHYWPKYSAAVLKAGMSVMVALSVAVFSVSILVVRDLLWMIWTPDVLCVAATMPAIGFALGYSMSAACRLGPQCSRTISMETGCQNIQLCAAILKVTFAPQLIGPMFLFPLLYISFQCAEALFLTLVFRCYHMIRHTEVKGHSCTHIAVERNPKEG